MSVETWYAARRAAFLALGVTCGQLVMGLLAVGLATAMEAAGLIPGPVAPSLRDAFASRPAGLFGLGSLWLATVVVGWTALERRRGRRLYGPGDLRPARARISTAGRLVLRRRPWPP